MAVQKIIIDTDPGVDDVLAMLLALSASPDEVEVVMLSVTYGNVALQGCLKNVVALFHVIQKEIEWRKSVGRPEGFDTLRANKPIVALGAEHPLEEDVLKSDNFHGLDGLHNVHTTYPDLSPEDAWEKVFKEEGDFSSYSPYFTPSKTPSYKEMIRILKENPADTVSILAVGPLTNVALAAAEDPETFLKVKQLVVMGGAITVEGNVTPVAEFNTYADAVASARVFALTSLTPSATMPPKTANTTLPDYPARLSRRLRLVLCPLDITCAHEITRSFFSQRVKADLDAGSPLAKWSSHFLTGAFTNIEKFWQSGQGEPGLALHDPFTVWYMIANDDPKWKFLDKPEDIRIETTGQWSRGMHIADRRGKRRPAEVEVELSSDPLNDPKIVALDTVHGDDEFWLSALKGNRVHRIVGSPGESLFKEVLMDRIFGKN